MWDGSGQLPTREPRSAAKPTINIMTVKISTMLRIALSSRAIRRRAAPGSGRSVGSICHTAAKLVHVSGTGGGRRA